MNIFRWKHVSVLLLIVALSVPASNQLKAKEQQLTPQEIDESALPWLASDQGMPSQWMQADRLGLRTFFPRFGRNILSALQQPSFNAGSFFGQMGDGVLQGLLGRMKADERLPEWAKRVDFGVRIGTEAPRVYVETTQPLWQTPNLSHTLFVQGRVTLFDGDGSYSGGVGYRKALFDNQLILGVNTFLDYTDSHDHSRVGGGAEVLSPYGEFRWNIYEPLSNAKRVGSSGTVGIFEEAVAGYDIELGFPAPYLPDLKVFARHQVWDFKSGGKDLNRDGARMEWYLSSFFRVDAETWYDSLVNGWDHRVAFVLRGDFDTTSRGFLFRGFNKQAFKPWTEKDAKWMTTYRVVREFDIVTQRTLKGPGVNISIGRGT